MSNILAELLEVDRWIRIAGSRVKDSNQFDIEIFDLVDSFLSEYVSVNSISTIDVIRMYNDFTSLYSQHIREFLISGKYPLENGIKVSFGREEYDVVLILSIVLSLHRHLIFKKLKSVISGIEGKTLLVGIGSGIEISFFDKFNKTVNAYDISIAPYVKNRFAKHNLVEEYFNGEIETYDHIFAIELMEHLPDPLAFGKVCFDSLKPGGHFYFTTATNIPQADHTVNFNDLDLFENGIKKIGFSVIENLEIKHESFDKKLNASNNWFDLKKSK